MNPLKPRPAAGAGTKCGVLINDNVPVHMLKDGPSRRYWTRNRANTAEQLSRLRVRSASIQTYDFRGFLRAHPREYAACPRRRNMTSGMLAVLHVLQRAPRVHTAGISGYATAGHGTSGEDAAFHQRNLEKYHCIDAERALLSRLVREGRVVPIDAPAGGPEQSQRGGGRPPR